MFPLVEEGLGDSKRLRVRPRDTQNADTDPGTPVSPWPSLAWDPVWKAYVWVELGVSPASGVCGRCSPR